MEFRWLIGFGCLMFMLPFILKGQDVRFKQMTTRDGMPENTGQALLQDRSGFLWVGTQNGLSRYDGYDWSTYSLSNNFIEALFEDKEGWIWVGTRSGINRMDPQTGLFETYRPDTSEYYGQNWMQYEIGQTTNGHIWFANFSGIFEVVDWATRTIHFYPIPIEKGDQHVSLAIAEDRVLVGKGKSLLEWSNGQFELLHQFSATINKVNWVGSTIWVGTQTGVWIWDFQVAPRRMDALTGKCTYQSFFKMDQSGILWVGTENGLFWLKDEKVVQHFFNQKDQPGSLSYNLVLDMLEDRQGLVWIGTGQGLNQFDPLHQQVLRLAGLPNDNVRAVAVDQQEALWIGTLDGLLKLEFDSLPVLSRTDPSDWTLRKRRLFTSRDGLKDRNITCLYADPRGDFWVGTNAGQLYQLDEMSQHFRSIELPAETRWVRTLVRDTLRDQLWIGGGNGFHCLNIKTGKLMDLSWMEPPNFAVYLNVYQDRLWIGHKDGLWIADLEEHTLEKYQQGLQDTTSLSNNLVTDMAPLGDSIWLTTFGGGVNIFKKGHFTAYDLPNNNIWCAYPDASGHMWMSTDDGVVRMDLGAHSMMVLNQGNGFNFDDYSLGVHARTPRGELLMGNPLGLNIFHPDSFQTNPFPPEVVLTDILINYQPLGLSLWPEEALILGPEDRTLTIRFSALNFRNPDKNLYAFRLKGYDSDWVATTAEQRLATYTALPPGRYVFQVKAANDQGVWNETGLELAIRVLPPFYKTWWFQVLAWLGVLGLVGGGVYWYNRRQYEKKWQQIRIQQKIQEERERISKDLHDSVGAHLTKIITDLDLLSLQMEGIATEATSQRVRGTRQFAQSTVQLLRDTIWVIHKDRFTAEEFANKAEAFLRYYLGDTITCSLHRSLVAEWTLSPTMVLNLLRILQEATQNMLKHSGATQYEVTITAKETLRMSIRDNGIGMAGKKEDGEEHYGLHNMARRASDIGGVFSIQSVPDQGLYLVVELPNGTNAR